MQKFTKADLELIRDELGYAIDDIEDGLRRGETDPKYTKKLREVYSKLVVASYNHKEKQYA